MTITETDFFSFFGIVFASAIAVIAAHGFVETMIELKGKYDRNLKTTTKRKKRRK